MINHIKLGTSSEDRRLADLISGFDLVNEEESTPEISTFASHILTAKKEVMVSDELQNGMPCFMHAGETHERGIRNIHDAIQLKSKRIGHGFQL